MNDSLTDISEVVDVDEPEEPNVEYTEVLHPQATDPTRGKPHFLFINNSAREGQNYLTYALAMKQKVFVIQISPTNSKVKHTTWKNYLNVKEHRNITVRIILILIIVTDLVNCI